MRGSRPSDRRWRGGQHREHPRRTAARRPTPRARSRHPPSRRRVPGPDCAPPSRSSPSWSTAGWSSPRSTSHSTGTTSSSAPTPRPSGPRPRRARACRSTAPTPSTARDGASSSPVSPSRHRPRRARSWRYPDPHLSFDLEPDMSARQAAAAPARQGCVMTIRGVVRYPRRRGARDAGVPPAAAAGFLSRSRERGAG
jgi:hypothetical protein